METPTGPAPAQVTVEPLRACQPAAITWTYPGATPPYTVDIFSNQSGELRQYASFSTPMNSVRWPEVDFAAEWRVFLRITPQLSNTTTTTTTTFIESGVQTVGECPVGGSCGCKIRPLPGGGTSTTSQIPSTPPSSSPPPSTPPSSSPPTSTPPTSTPPTSTPPTTTPQSSTSAPPPSGSSPPPVVKPSDWTKTVTQTPSGGGLQSQRPASGKSTDNTGIIVGSVAGGIAFVTILSALLFFLCRWRRQRNRRRKLEDEFDLSGHGLYDPGYHSPSGDRDMEEIDADGLTPYPFTAPLSYDSNTANLWDNSGHGWPDARYSHEQQATRMAGLMPGPGPGVASSASLPTVPTYSSTSPTMPSLGAGSHASLPAPPGAQAGSGIRRTVTTTAIAVAPAREAKLEAERRRTRSLQRARASADMRRPRLPPVQAEDAGFVADGGSEVPPLYQPEWERAQREQLGSGAA